ncbi:MAG: tRNA adenosine(34) deaminase TadA [Firmicutes bacterium]|nr:tRNA adenosine(34) deaminase TadA [Bacillota bacterium]
MMEEQDYMRRALALAEEAALDEETPIGCVIVRDGEIIGEGRNRRNTLGNPLAHAEMEAINQASGVIGDWRLEDCTLYVTLEPCPMCAGAIVQARIKRVVIGAMNPKAGCAGSIFNLLIEPRFNHRCEVETGMLEEESRTILQRFFGGLRKKAAEAKQKEAGLMKAENAPGCVISENMV